MKDAHRSSANWGGLVGTTESRIDALSAVTYFEDLRWKAITSSPVPSKSTVAGSGT
jgi:hypothetical protein